jgi:carboxypeptidase Q
MMDRGLHLYFILCSSMVDNGYLGRMGVPTLKNLIADTPTSEYYFTYHHSAGDSMTMMNPDTMDDNVVAIASIFYLIADLDKPLPRD